MRLESPGRDAGQGPSDKGTETGKGRRRPCKEMMGRRGPPGRLYTPQRSASGEPGGTCALGSNVLVVRALGGLPTRHRCGEADIQHLASAVLWLRVHAYKF